MDIPHFLFSCVNFSIAALMNYHHHNDLKKHSLLVYSLVGQDSGQAHLGHCLGSRKTKN